MRGPFVSPKCGKRALYWRLSETTALYSRGRKERKKESHFVFPGVPDGKESARNVGDAGSIPGLGRSPGEGNGNPLQYSCLGNPIDESGGLQSRESEESDTTQRLHFLSFSSHLVSWIRLFGTPWTVCSPPGWSMGFSRQDCCSGLPFPSPHAVKQGFKSKKQFYCNPLENCLR